MGWVTSEWMGYKNLTCCGWGSLASLQSDGVCIAPRSGLSTERSAGVVCPCSGSRIHSWSGSVRVMTLGDVQLDAEVLEAFPEFRISLPRLGQGTFKVAYHASDAQGPFVLKVLREGGAGDEDGPIVDERFLREVNLMAKLDSPRIVRLRDAAQVRDIGGLSRVWYAEPYYSGGSLDAILESGPLSPDDVWRLAIHLFEAIECLEGAGIVHRDIKPGNICQDGDGNFILVDLGIARVESMSPLTATGQISPMTTMYAAPEQFVYSHATRIDSRTDMFAAGIVLHEAAMGRHPFFEDGISVPDYLKKISGRKLGEIPTSECHPILGQVIDRCLSDRMNRRYRNAKQAISTLTEAERRR